MTNKNNNVLYCGITDNIIKRVFQHKNKILKGFTAKYNINKIVYYEHLNSLEEALEREKRIKAGSRKKKIELIEKYNKEWKDLSDNFWGLIAKE